MATLVVETSSDVTITLTEPVDISVSFSYVVSVSSNIIYRNQPNTEIIVSVPSPTFTFTNGFAFNHLGSTIEMSVPRPTLTHTRELVTLTRVVGIEDRTTDAVYSQEKRTLNSRLNEYPSLLTSLLSSKSTVSNRSQQFQEQWNQVVTSNISNKTLANEMLNYNSNNYALFSRGLNVK